MGTTYSYTIRTVTVAMQDTGRERAREAAITVGYRLPTVTITVGKNPSRNVHSYPPLPVTQRNNLL